MLVGRGISAAHGRESKDMSNRRNAVQMKEEINSNRKINNQILGAEKEVESGDWGWLLSAVQTAEIQPDRGWGELRCRRFSCGCCFYGTRN